MSKNPSQDQPACNHLTEHSPALLMRDEAEATALKSEISNLSKNCEKFRQKYESCVLEKKQLEQELESTRATSVERKNSLKAAQEKINHSALVIENLKKEAETRETQQAALVKNLIRLEGQLELLKDLVTRA